jgi:hypothetical protein
LKYFGVDPEHFDLLELYITGFLLLWLLATCATGSHLKDKFYPKKGNFPMVLDKILSYHTKMTAGNFPFFG